MAGILHAYRLLPLHSLVNLSKMAEWRRRKAEQYPENPRNSRAAMLLDSLAIDLAGYEASSLHMQLIDLWGEGKMDRFGYDLFGEVVDEELRRVGFSTFPDSVEELLNKIMERLRA